MKRDSVFTHPFNNDQGAPLSGAPFMLVITTPSLFGFQNKGVPPYS